MPKRCRTGHSPGALIARLSFARLGCLVRSLRARSILSFDGFQRQPLSGRRSGIVVAPHVGGQGGARVTIHLPKAAKLDSGTREGL